MPIHESIFYWLHQYIHYIQLGAIEWGKSGGGLGGGGGGSW